MRVAVHQPTGRSPANLSRDVVPLHNMNDHNSVIARILQACTDRCPREAWVLGSNWWILPAFVVCLDIVSSVLFAFSSRSPGILDLSAINASLMCTGYTVVILLSPGFSLRHLLVAVTLQIVTPLLFAMFESGQQLQWIIAQLLVSSSLLLIHRVISLPPWRHARFGGSVNKTFSIRSLLLLTAVVALAIMMLRASELDTYYFSMVLMLCGPPVAGWVAALLLTKLRPVQVAVVIAAGACVICGLCLYESFWHVSFGYEVEPLWMVASAISTMIAASLLQLPFQRPVRERATIGDIG